MCYFTLFDCWFAWLVLSCLDGWVLWLLGCLDIKIDHQLQMKHWAQSTQRALTCLNRHSYLTGGDMVMLMMIMVVKMMQMIMTKARQWAVK